MVGYIIFVWLLLAFAYSEPLYIIANRLTLIICKNNRTVFGVQFIKSEHINSWVNITKSGGMSNEDLVLVILIYEMCIFYY